MGSEGTPHPVSWSPSRRHCLCARGALREAGCTSGPATRWSFPNFCQLSPLTSFSVSHYNLEVVHSCLGIVDIGSSIMQSILILISRYIYKNSVLIHACFALRAQEGVSDTPLCSSATRKPFWRLTKCPAISPPSFSTAPRKTALVNSVFANCSFGLEHWK